MILAGVDRASFAAALGNRLRSAGLPIDLSRLESLVAALEVVDLGYRSELYWAARISLVRHQRELAVFDEVFAAVFDAVVRRDPHARRDPLGAPAPRRGDGWVPGTGGNRGAPEQDGAGLPWVTRPSLRAAPGGAQDGSETLLIDDPLPSPIAGLADTPFDELNDGQLAALSTWLEAAAAQWPTRRTRRTRPHPRGSRIDLRATLARGRATGWEPVRLVRQRPVRARRRVVMLCDVSRSMAPYSSVYLHLMRAAALSAQAEVFAFSTSLTRLTPALADRSGGADREQGSNARVIERAAARVTDRSGGTRIGFSLRQFLRCRHAGSARGAIVIIASDGWDADEPAALEAAMSRLHRRARLVIWLNPRAAAPGFEPLAGAMAAALPYCDELLPADTLNAMRDVVAAITRVR